MALLHKMSSTYNKYASALFLFAPCIRYHYFQKGLQKRPASALPLNKKQSSTYQRYAYSFNLNGYYISFSHLYNYQVNIMLLLSNIRVQSRLKNHNYIERQKI